MLHATARLLSKARCTNHLGTPLRKAFKAPATLAATRGRPARPDLGSWPNQQQQCHRTAMGDVVDLTLSDSDEEVPVLQERQQARAPTAAKQSTAAAPASPPPAAEAAAAEEVQARKRIMEFARGKAAQFAQGRAAAAAAGAGLSTADADAGDDNGHVLSGAAKRAKPSPSEETAPSRADDDAYAATQAKDSAAAAAGGGGGAAASGGGISNEDLRSLHEARMRRQQQQQQQQQQEGDAKPQEDARQGNAPAGSAPAASPAAAAGGSRRRSRSPAARSAGAKPAAGSAAAAAAAGGGSRSISLLTYNVWFKEEVAVLERMIGLGDIVRRAGLPTFICLQEVTPLILEILANMEWWQQYTASPHPYDMTYFTLLLVKRSADHSLSDEAFKHREFQNSVMARGLRSAKVSIAGQQITVATTHLESPIPPQAFYSRERQQQMAEALRVLDAEAAGNVLFAGDMNWEDKRDGAPPLPDSWVDAWATLQPGRPGITYDAKNNPMLPFKGTPPLRLDRILCKLREWRLGSIELVGTQALPGITYTHRFRNGGSKELPVLPSDHFGLLLRLEPA